MSLFEELWRWDAGRRASDEGNLTLFRRHYDDLKPEQKRNVYALVSALSKLWGGDGVEGFARRCQEFGDTEAASLDVSLAVVSAHPEGRATYRLDPTQLKDAIERWDRGEDYFPPAKIDHQSG